MTYTGKYSHLLEEVEGEIWKMKEGKVKEALKERLAAIDDLKTAVEELESEVKQLMKTGRITDLSTYVKIDCGENKDVSAPIVISRSSTHRK